MSDAKTNWEDLIAAEAADIADRENEASSHCGPYGTETAADYIEEVRTRFEQIGEAYTSLCQQVLRELMNKK